MMSLKERTLHIARHIHHGDFSNAQRHTFDTHDSLVKNDGRVVEVCDDQKALFYSVARDAMDKNGNAADAKRFGNLLRSLTKDNPKRKRWLEWHRDDIDAGLNRPHSMLLMFADWWQRLRSR